ncbi:MAG TPA: cell division ATP-binding protein FtsE [Steroidobacteraceae bacterium]
MIRFEHVSKRYPNGREALADLNFEIADGEMAFLTGRSGAGKSSVLKLIALLERPTRGQVVVNGHATARLPLRRVALYRRQLGVVFQDHRLLMDRPVFDNVALPLIVSDVSFKEADRRVRAALDQVGLLGKERMAPIELSVGEQQRVGIARAIVSKPPLLVADEPTGNLDTTLAGEVLELFHRFNEVGVTVLIATHDRRLVQALGRREIRLEHGRIAEGEEVPDGTAEEHITIHGPPPVSF